MGVTNYLLHPGKLRWNLKTPQLKKEHHLPNYHFQAPCFKMILQVEKSTNWDDSPSSHPHNEWLGPQGGRPGCSQRERLEEVGRAVTVDR